MDTDLDTHGTALKTPSGSIVSLKMHGGGALRGLFICADEESEMLVLAELPGAGADNTTQSVLAAHEPSLDRITVIPEHAVEEFSV
jgi:hypothetical protein